MTRSHRQAYRAVSGVPSPFDTVALAHLRPELGAYSRELDDAGEPLEKIAIWVIRDRLR